MQEMCNPRMAKRSHLTKSGKQEYKFLLGLSEQSGEDSSVGRKTSNLDLRYPSLPSLSFCGKDGLCKDTEICHCQTPEKASQRAEMQK